VRQIQTVNGVRRQRNSNSERDEVLMEGNLASKKFKSAKKKAKKNPFNVKAAKNFIKARKARRKSLMKKLKN